MKSGKTRKDVNKLTIDPPLQNVTTPTPSSATMSNLSEDEVRNQFKYMAQNKMNIQPNQVEKMLQMYKKEKLYELIQIYETKEKDDSFQPKYYLDQLTTHYDAESQKKNRKHSATKVTTMVLKELEICLRTYSVNWVSQFLDRDQGLGILIDFMEWSLSHLMHSDWRKTEKRKRQTVLQCVGEPEDDVYWCVKCIRAIMNSGIGFPKVYNNQRCLKNITQCLMHNNHRAKSLVLEVLTAISLVNGCHEKLLEAFDHFKKTFSEKLRFETLVDSCRHIFSHERTYDEHELEYLKAAVQFINIFVHTTDDMQFRIYLQHEFLQVDFDSFLNNVLQRGNQETLSQYAQAYLGNLVNVEELIKDAEEKRDVLAENVELKEKCDFQVENIQFVKEENHRIQELLEKSQAEKVTAEKERELLRTKLNTLESLLSDKDAQMKKTQSVHEESMKELQKARESLRDFNSMSAKSNDTSADNTGTYVKPNSNKSGSTPQPIPRSAAPPPPPPPPGPPPGPPLPPGGGIPPPPPPPGGLSLPGANITLKRTLTSKARLSTIHVQSVPMRLVASSIFSKLDDEKVAKNDKLFDTAILETMFKEPETRGRSVISQANDFTNDEITPYGTISKKKATTLKADKQRNVGISMRRLPAIKDLIEYITSYDITKISTETLTILVEVLPSEDEKQALRSCDSEELAQEDQFLAALLSISRLEAKIAIMQFMAEFQETYGEKSRMQQDFNAVLSVSYNLVNSKKFRELYEFLLAIINYVNSKSKGAVYGFQLSSLEKIATHKSKTTDYTMLMYVVDQAKKASPHLLTFADELGNIDRAQHASLSYQDELARLKQMMGNTKREIENSDGKHVNILNKFVNNSERIMNKVLSDYTAASKQFEEAVKYFGEDSQRTKPSEFFSHFVRFNQNFKSARIALDNLKKKRENKASRNVVDEMKNRNRLRQRDMKENMQYGVIDQISSETKEPFYRRPPTKNPRAMNPEAYEKLHQHIMGK